MSTTLTYLAILAQCLLITAVMLRAMVIASRADRAADSHWQDLQQLQSDSGVAFFPTAEARLELELTLSEAIEVEREASRPRRKRHSSALSRAAAAQ